MSPTAIDLLAQGATVFTIIFLNDLLRYGLAAGGLFALAYGLFAHQLAGRRIHAGPIQKGQIAREILSSVRTVLIFAAVGLLLYLNRHAGVFDIYSDPGERGWVWFWASLVLLILGHDAWFYWIHRLMHDKRLYRRFHWLHHRSVIPTPFAAYAFDIGEAVLMALYLPLAAFLMPVAELAVFVFSAHMIVRNVMAHSNFELFPAGADGRPLFDWIATSTHHMLHHRRPGCNYGFYFTFWDRVMGTEAPDYHLAFAAAVRKPLRPRTARPVRQTVTGLIAAGLVIGGLILGGVSEVSAGDGEEALERIAGDWAGEGYGIVVNMRGCGDGDLCGDLIWAWEPDEIKGVAVGEEMLSDFAYQDGSWTGGSLTHPETGRTYRGSIRQVSDDMLELKGCAGPFCSSQTWRRLESLPHMKSLMAR